MMVEVQDSSSLALYSRVQCHDCKHGGEGSHLATFRVSEKGLSCIFWLEWSDYSPLHTRTCNVITCVIALSSSFTAAVVAFRLHYDSYVTY